MAETQLIQVLHQSLVLDYRFTLNLQSLYCSDPICENFTSALIYCVTLVNNKIKNKKIVVLNHKVLKTSHLHCFYTIHNHFSLINYLNTKFNCIRIRTKSQTQKIIKNIKAELLQNFMTIFDH